MRKFLFILLTFISFAAAAQKVVGTLQRNGTSDTYAVVPDSLVKGGFRIVADTTERNMIPYPVRKAGMVAYSVADTTWWQLKNGILNVHWKPVLFGQGSNMATAAQTFTGNWLHDGNGKQLFINNLTTTTIQGNNAQVIISQSGSNSSRADIRPGAASLISANGGSSSAKLEVRFDSMIVSNPAGIYRFKNIPYNSSSSLRMIVYDSVTGTFYRQQLPTFVQPWTDLGSAVRYQGDAVRLGVPSSINDAAGLYWNTSTSLGELRLYRAGGSPGVYAYPNFYINYSSSGSGYQLAFPNNTTARSVAWPDKSGTVAFLDDITSPANMVTINTSQSITGAKTFTQKIVGSSYAFPDANGNTTGMFSPSTNIVLFKSQNNNVLEYDTGGWMRFHAYGRGSVTGTVAKYLAVDTLGNLIETNGGAGGSEISVFDNGDFVNLFDKIDFTGPGVSVVESNGRAVVSISGGNGTSGDADSLGGQPASYYATQSALTTGLAGKANTSHTHSASDITGTKTSSFIADFTAAVNAIINAWATANEKVLSSKDFQKVSGDVRTRKAMSQIHTSGATVTTTDSTTWLIVNPSSTLASLTITLTTPPQDGHELKISFGGAMTSGIIVTSLTLSGTINGSVTYSGLELNDTILLKYNTTTGKWYK